MALSSSVGRFVSGLGPRSRKILRYAGFALLALVTFVFAFQAVFPFQRVKDRIIDALSDKYDVSIASIERGFIPGRMYIHAITVRTRPTKSDEVASTLYVEQLEVDLGILALLRGAVSVKLDAKIGVGRIHGTVALSKTNTSVDLDGSDLPSGSLPMREVIGLPMTGKLRFAVELELPNEKAKTGNKVGPNWAKAAGFLEVACPSACVVGDGKTKLKPKLKNQRQQAMAEGGIDFGKVNIDSLVARLEIKNGKADITRFDAKSGDGSAKLELDVALNQDINSSLVSGCLRFNGTDALLKREPKTFSAISLTGAPLGPDNMYHIKLDGPIKDLKKLPLVCGPAANTAMDNPGGAPARPSLSPTSEPAHVPNIPPPTSAPPPIVPPNQPPPQPAQVTFPDDAGVPEAGAPGVSPQGEAVTPGQPIPQPTGAAEPPAGGVARP
jgi:type II secretion system protein N